MLKPLLLILMCAAVPLALWAIARNTRGGSTPSKAPAVIDEPAPQSIELAGRESFEVADNVFDGQGFPILNWQSLDEWASAGEPAAIHDAVTRGRRAWLAHFRDVLGGTRLLETHDAWVLSSYEPRLANAVADYVSLTRSRITRLLEGIAHFSPHERSIFVAFDTRDQYYQYVTNYYPEDGEFAFSGGMYINAGCPHFVTVKDDLWRLEPVIAHELTHSALTHLHLPLWLDEGIAVTTEHQISDGSGRQHRERVELIGKHLAFWNAGRMQEFWSGDSFRRTDDGNALSYDLAANIVALVGREWDPFVEFVNGAGAQDAGAGAAKAALNIDLGHLAAAALNVAVQPGWSPDPETWKNAPRLR